MVFVSSTLGTVVAKKLVRMRVEDLHGLGQEV